MGRVQEQKLRQESPQSFYFVVNSAQLLREMEVAVEVYGTIVVVTFVVFESEKKFSASLPLHLDQLKLQRC